MSQDPRVALENLASALAEHLNAVLNRRGEDDPAVEEAYERIAASFEDYEDALWDATGEGLPLDLYADDDDADDDTEEEADEG